MRYGQRILEILGTTGCPNRCRAAAGSLRIRVQTSPLTREMSTPTDLCPSRFGLSHLRGSRSFWPLTRHRLRQPVLPDEKALVTRFVQPSLSASNNPAKMALVNCVIPVRSMGHHVVRGSLDPAHGPTAGLPIVERDSKCKGRQSVRGQETRAQHNLLNSTHRTTTPAGSAAMVFRASRPCSAGRIRTRRRWNR